ncbi:SusC/RagA family TonB-linked outer membrane protein [soil metagenome]
MANHHGFLRPLFPGLALVALLPVAGLAQTPTVVSGEVRASDGTPLNGASVTIAALRVGATSNAAGQYTFTVPASATGRATLTARRIGYTPESVEITLTGGAVRQDFTLEVGATELAQVVVTALGVEREKARLGTAQQQLTAGEINETRAQNLVQQIQGKVSGVQITGPSTQGGSTNVIIRGQNSITGNNQPLFIVDGVAVSNASRGGDIRPGGGTTNFDYGNAISDLNPDDIESLSILKGPNAAALYGSRAANGVIIINTRKGRNTGGRMRSELNTTITWERPSVIPDFQNQYGQGLEGDFRYVDGNYGGINDGVDESWGPKMDGRLICQFDSPGAGTDGCVPTPWVAHPENVKDYFRTGMTIASTVAVSGGTERAFGRLSMGADNVSGIFENNLFQRRTASLTGSFRASDKLTTDGTVQYIRNTGRNRPGVGYSGRNPLQQFNWFGRQIDMASLRDYQKCQPDGSCLGAAANGGPATREYNWNYSYHNNPFWIMGENPEIDDRDRVIGSVSARYQIAEGLAASVRTGSDIYRFGVQQLYAQGAEEFINLAYAGGFRYVNDYRNDNNTDATITLDRQLNDRFQLSAVAGGNMRREYFRSNSQQTTGILVPRVYNPSNAAVAPAIAEFVERRHVNGIYGSAAFTMNEWWTVEGTARNDWSSTLPVGKNSYFYPSVNTSIVLTDAMPSLGNRMLSSLKLRGAWAQVGSDARPYSLVPVFQGNANRFNNQPQYALDTRLANGDLKPEITTSLEMGAELAMFENRMTLDASWYDKKTKDQVFDVEISPASGFDRKWVNAGEISNRGIEALVNLNLLQSPNGLTWNSTLNFARNRSKVVELAPDVSTIVLGRGLFGADVFIEARKGEPYGAIRGYRFLRDEQGNQLVSEGYPIRDAQLSLLGNIQPDWTGGWGNQLSYGNVSLNTQLDIRRGGDVYSITNYLGEYAGVLSSSLRGREVDWDTPGFLVEGIDIDTGQPNTTRISSEEYFHSLFGIHEPYVMDGGYVKLREVRLSYNLPGTWANRMMGARAATIAFTGRNLVTWKNIPNIDPEFSYSSRNDQGVEYMMPSNPRSFGFNLRIIP